MNEQPSSNDLVIAAVIAENPYTRYSYPAQNDTVERERAGRYAIMIAKEVLRRTAPEPGAFPTFTCPNCEVTEEFSVRHDTVEDRGHGEGYPVVPVVQCTACGQECRATLRGDESRIDLSPAPPPGMDYIPAREYPGDWKAAEEVGLPLHHVTCTCGASGEDVHRETCRYWINVLEARTKWHDRNIVAWSCRWEADGGPRCARWCGHNKTCIATGKDRRATSTKGEGHEG